MPEYSGTSEDEEIKKLKDRLDIIIIKVVKSWGEVRKNALIDEVHRVASRVLPERKGRETIRKRIDKLVKDGILIREGTRKNAIIKVGGNVAIDETVEAFAKEVERVIRLRVEEGLVLDKLRVKHTEKIKERILRPWIRILLSWGDDIRSINEIVSIWEYFKTIENDVYYRDLDNHIPSQLKNLKEIKESIDRLIKECIKLEEELRNLKISFHENICKKLGLNKKREDTDFKLKAFIKEFVRERAEDNISLKRKEDVELNEILSKIEEILGEIPVEILEIFVRNDEMLINKLKNIKGFIEEELQKYNKKRDKLKIKLDKIRELKKKLLRVLEELEAYEILPGICKYLRGE